MLEAKREKAKAAEKEDEEDFFEDIEEEQDFFNDMEEEDFFKDME
jgi:hypothetical protein